MRFEMKSWASRWVLIAPLGLLSMVACSSGSSSPTETKTSAPQLSNVTVSVDGVVYNGSTYDKSAGTASGTRFEAHMTFPDGSAATGGQVSVEYQRGMMMHGTFQLYDDGTHGDQTPGDGIYCYEDDMDQYGFCHQSDPAGDYHYNFQGYCQGENSNQMQVTVHVD